MFQHDRKEDAKQGLGKYAALLYTIVDVKCLGGRAIKLNDPFHVCVKRLDDAEELRWAPNLCEDSEQAFPVYEVKGLGEVDEGKVERSSLFSALLL